MQVASGPDRCHRMKPSMSPISQKPSAHRALIRMLINTMYASLILVSFRVSGFPSRMRPTASLTNGGIMFGGPVPLRLAQLGVDLRAIQDLRQAGLCRFGHFLTFAWHINPPVMLPPYWR